MNFSGDNKLLFWMLAGRVVDAIVALRETGCWKLLSEWHSVDELAVKSGGSRKPLWAILNLLSKAGFIERNGGHYRIDRRASAIEDFIHIELELQQRFAAKGGIGNGLRGHQFDPLDVIVDPEFFEAYAGAMRLNARPLALAMLRIGGGFDYSRILDLGGGDGAMSGELLCRIPDAFATVVDREGMRASCDRLVESMELAGRLDFAAFDIEDPASYRRKVKESSIFILSNIIHLIGIGKLHSILEEILEHARRDANIILYDLFVGATGDITLSDLVSMDWVAGGHPLTKTIDDLEILVRDMGFNVDVHANLPLLPGGILIASR